MLLPLFLSISLMPKIKLKTAMEQENVSEELNPVGKVTNTSRLQILKQVRTVSYTVLDCTPSLMTNS